MDLQPSNAPTSLNKDSKMNISMRIADGISRSSTSYTKLKDFLGELGAGDNNIIEQKKASYCVPENRMAEFFKLLNQVNAENTVTHFSEKQLNPSGVMLDFDIVQENSESQIKDDHIYTITMSAINELLSMLEHPDSVEQVYALVIKKSAVVYSTKKQGYKDGFHILIPSIKINKNAKKYLIRQLNDKGLVKSAFNGLEFINDDILDLNSAHVVTLFHKNCKPGGTPYDTYNVYNAKVINGGVIRLVPQEHKSWNLGYEFSLNYEKVGGHVQKREYALRVGIASELKTVESKEQPLSDNLSILSLHDPDAAMIINLMSLISVKRCEEYSDWFKIVTTLAYLGEEYRPVAWEFSNRRERGAREEFDKTWENARLNVGKYPYTKSVIYSYAKKDDPEGYKKATNTAVFSAVTDMIFDKNTVDFLGHYHFATLLHKMLKNMFVVDYVGGQPKWFEFVIDPKDMAPGEMYKWRLMSSTGKISVYLSEKMRALFCRVLDHIEQLAKKAGEAEKITYYNNTIKRVRKSIVQLNNSSFKSLVIREALNLFEVPRFAKNLDKAENVMGIGNGILVFDKGPKLIESFHQYKVSRYSTTKFSGISKTHVAMRAVFKSIWDLFPDDEKDAMHYILFFLCTSLTGRIKPCLFLTLQGNGANGKSFLLELFNNLLGKTGDNGYGYKMQIQYLIDREQAAGNASPELVPLKYARMTYFSEPEKNERLRVSKKKKLTSHEPINVRDLYCGQENIIHKSNFVLATNYELIIDSTDNGTWRRERYYTMKIKFCRNPDVNNPLEKKDDPSFSVKKTKDPEFLSGMLSLMCVYLTILDHEYNGNIKNVISPTIDEETERFRNRQDNINRFLTERVVVLEDKNAETLIGEMVDIYCVWYNKTISERRHNKRDIAKMLENSKLCKFVQRRRGGIAIRGHRALAMGEHKDENEQFMIEFKESKKKERSDKKVDYNRSFEKLIDRYDAALVSYANNA